MEETIKDQASLSANAGRSKLRYPLRSASKSKEDKPIVGEMPNSSAKRGRQASNVSKSVNVLDLSGNKPSKPPRRLSIPAKSTTCTIPRVVGNITPISEAKSNRSFISNQGKSDTPVSDVSRSSSQRRFNVLASASYWISQIRIAESASKHSISLGFFKLALEAGCEPIQRLQDELKVYVRRHNLVEFGDLAKELLVSYNVAETVEQLHETKTRDLVAEEENQSPDDEVLSCPSTTGPRKLKPKLVNSISVQLPFVRESIKDSNVKDNSIQKTRVSLSRNSVNSKPNLNAGTRSLQKKLQNVSLARSNDKKDMVKKKGKKCVAEKGAVSTLPAEEIIQEDKENMDAPQVEEICVSQE